MENFAGKIRKKFPVKINREKKPFIIEFAPMLEQLLREIDEKREKEEIAYKFHLWISDSILELLKYLKPEIVVLSGGCFQNKLLFEMLDRALREHKFSYFANEQVPINDAGIAFGQALV